ncbi:terminase small subunit [Burkholderia gladioli]|uniref:terminase small subunit n=1 Tax=Burkholderia gladioli TaxID=28095 RepID=UPI00264D9FF1|nr:terminase small subunit [Burkholderia gladioli]MDN7495018.1 terminase small subunit [Burkholderia gladioli]
MKTQKLTPKQQAFVDEYLVDLCAAAAARRAGYSERTAVCQAARLLSKANVQTAITAAMSKRAERVQVDAAYVVQRLVEIDKMDVLDILNDDMSLKPVSEWPRVWRQYLSGFDLAEMFEGSGDERAMVGILKKIKWPDKVKNLELLGRHFSIFNDKLELSRPKVRVKDMTGRKPKKD